MRANSKDEHGLGYTRIGIWCDSGRRSLWCRITPKQDAIRQDPEPIGAWFVAEAPNVLCVELCAGREGDDEYVKIEPDNPAFAALIEVLASAEYAVDMAQSKTDEAWLTYMAAWIFKHDPEESEIRGILEQALLRGMRPREDDGAATGTTTPSTEET